jgi:hypothetical protein
MGELAQSQALLPAEMTIPMLEKLPAAFADPTMRSTDARCMLN